MTERGLKIATIGGGSSYTPELIEGFLKRMESLPVKDIYLVDIDAGMEKLQIVTALARRMAAKSGTDLQIHATTDRREALKDADFVTTQFRVGLLDARIRDEQIPLRYQKIGQETTGAGGFAKALRSVPVILDICRDMEELCPDAWLINFANPSGILTEAVLNHTSIKAIGLCNCPINMINDMAEKFDCPVDDVFCDFVGINHLVWAQRVLVRGHDVTSEAIDKICSDSAKEIMANIPEIHYDPVFLKSLGMVPVSYLKYYYMQPEMLAECIRAAKEEGCRGEVIKKVEKELFDLYRDPALDSKPAQLASRGGARYSDAACSLIDSIYNNKKDIQTVNVLNRGTNLDLPYHAVIERNCVIDADGAHPIHIGHTPLKIRGLLQTVKAYEQLTIEAAITGDYDKALQALTIHPLVNSATVARKILDDILAENQPYLETFKNNSLIPS
ncbi:MAG: 6-phospho-beta-glucosidase [Lachnospiraceae bacterium]|nr:6-phospho-beta-glucosidase [Lachnospiraceae bacterium]